MIFFNGWSALLKNYAWNVGRSGRKGKTGCEFARVLMLEKGGRNKLASLLGVSGPYLGRVLGGKKPMTAEVVSRLKYVVDAQ